MVMGYMGLLFRGLDGRKQKYISWDDRIYRMKINGRIERED
jgi:hypothetical protein